MEKLTSRKFWVTVATAAYFALMALKEQGTDTMVSKIVYGICAAAVIVGYVIIEGVIDVKREDEAEEETHIELEDNQEEEAA